jgi:hypothetical protein
MRHPLKIPTIQEDSIASGHHPAPYKAILTDIPRGYIT